MRIRPASASHHLLTIVLAAFLSIVGVACEDDGPCGGCPQGKFCCEDGECHPCCVDDDCAGKIADCPEELIACSDEYECECNCLEEGEDCPGGLDVCCSGLNCEMGACMPPCTTDMDCLLRYPNDPHGASLECKQGTCMHLTCVDDLDCSAGCLCWEGYCIPCDCPELRDCVVLPGAAVIREGAIARFSATAYLQSGAIAPGYTFTWETSDEAVATVDATGLVTGSADSGAATITASVLGCCDPVCHAVVFNHGSLPAGSTRLVAVDELSELPIQGARVVVGSQAPVLTDANGEAVIGVELNAGNPQDISVFKQDYDYVTLKSVRLNDVIVHLSPLHHLDFSKDPPEGQAGGIEGKFDFDMIRCEPPLSTCDVSLALGGLSVPPSLTRLGLDMLAGGVVMTEVMLGGTTASWPFAEGLVWCLSQTCYKECYTPVGVPGNRVAWGLGGKLDFAEMIDLVGPMFISGEFDTLELILGMEPFLGTFYSALVPNLDIVPRPMVADANDLDGDPGTDVVPDYDNFPPQNMTLKIRMEQEMICNAPILPAGVYDRVVLVGGLIVNGAGFVPLGIALGKDSKDAEDPPDGVIEDPIVLNVADVAGRIPEEQVQRVVLAVADKPGEEGPVHRAVRILFVDAFSGTHSLPGFLQPAEATYDSQGRRLEIASVPGGADFLLAVFSGEEGSNWQVLTEEFAGFDLPAAPAEGDRGAELSGVYAVDLGTGGYQDLVEFNDLNLGNIVEAAVSFSVVE